MSSKHLALIMCLLCLAQPAIGETKPNDNRSSSSDSRSSEYSQGSLPKVDKVGGRELNLWVKDLTHPDPSAVSRALMALPQFGQDAAQYVPNVCKCLRHHDASPRVKAIQALRMMYIPTPLRGSVIKDLGQCLIDSNSQTIHRYEAVLTLMRFGQLQGDERAAVQDLVRNLGSPSTYELRDICIVAIMTAGVDEKKGPEPQVTDALILRATPAWEPAEQVRLKAIMALGAMGRPQDPKKLSQVINVLKGPGNFYSRNKAIKMWSHVALMALEDKIYEKELQAMADLLKEEESEVKIQAVTALGALRDKAHAYVRDICDMLRREKDPQVLRAGAAALARMGNKGDRVINALIRMTELEDSEKQPAVIAACQALADLGANDAQVMDAVEKASKHPSLNKYEKPMITNALEDLKHPRKKPEKNPAKNPEKPVAGGRNGR